MEDEPFRINDTKILPRSDTLRHCHKMYGVIELYNN